MMRIRDFFTNLARASKDYLEIKEIVESVKALKKPAIYNIITKAKNCQNTEDQCKLDGKKRSGPRLSSPLLLPPPLHKELGLEKKSTRRS
jgi:hypothetical protein